LILFSPTWSLFSLPPGTIVLNCPALWGSKLAWAFSFGPQTMIVPFFISLAQMSMLQFTLLIFSRSGSCEWVVCHPRPVFFSSCLCETGVCRIELLAPTCPHRSSPCRRCVFPPFRKFQEWFYVFSSSSFPVTPDRSVLFFLPSAFFFFTRRSRCASPRPLFASLSFPRVC